MELNSTSKFLKRMSTSMDRLYARTLMISDRDTLIADSKDLSSMECYFTSLTLEGLKGPAVG